VSGLTTAAGLWVSAGVGLSVGFGLFGVGILATFLTLFVFVALGFVKKKLQGMSLRAPSTSSDSSDIDNDDT
jgi:putative Mg2+ transporter-C (MgtC) family protein